MHIHIETKYLCLIVKKALKVKVKEPKAKTIKK
jgi:hypothetical protein